jgi:hypothetical protein
MATFTDLPFDVFVLILRNLEVRDIVRIWQVRGMCSFEDLALK